MHWHASHSAQRRKMREVDRIKQPPNEGQSMKFRLENSAFIASINSKHTNEKHFNCMRRINNRCRSKVALKDSSWVFLFFNVHRLTLNSYSKSWSLSESHKVINSFNKDKPWVTTQFKHGLNTSVSNCL